MVVACFLECGCRVVRMINGKRVSGHCGTKTNTNEGNILWTDSISYHSRLAPRMSSSIPEKEDVWRAAYPTFWSSLREAYIIQRNCLLVEAWSHSYGPAAFGGTFPARIDDSHLSLLLFGLSSSHTVHANILWNKWTQLSLERLSFGLITAKECRENDLWYDWKSKRVWSRS